MVGDDLAVDHGLVRERLRSTRDRSEARGEVFAVAREQSDAAVRLQPERAIAIEFEFVCPDGALQELTTASLSIGSTNPTLTLSVFTF